MSLLVIALAAAGLAQDAAAAEPRAPRDWTVFRWEEGHGFSLPSSLRDAAQVQVSCDVVADRRVANCGIQRALPHDPSFARSVLRDLRRARVAEGGPIEGDTITFNVWMCRSEVRVQLPCPFTPWPED